MSTPSQALSVTDLFEAAGYHRIEPEILQPADIFLDLSGEEIRHRLLLTTDNEGREWALRPEFTIPVARAYLASGSLKEAGYSYYGPVFRARSGEPSEHAGLLKAMQGQDPRAARGFVEDLLKIAGISSVGGRSAGEIAERFLSQASREDEGTFSDESRSVLQRFLAIEGDPDSVADSLRALSDEAELHIDPVIDAFETRAGFYAARGIDLNEVFFSARFGRNLDYYTGAVFEIRRKTDQRIVVGGGRYDRLLKLLGASDAIPAVGCAVFIDRLQGGAA